MRRLRTIPLLLCLTAALAVAVVSVPAPGSAQGAAVANDIDGDGDGDLLVGVPLEAVAGQAEAGVVNVILSNGNRLAAEGNIVLRQGDGIPGEVESLDLFGAAVELVDIDADGYADAVIGSSGETVGLNANAGVFHVVPGSAQGLDRSAARTYTQGQAGLPGEAGVNDFLGFNIASGDYNGDGFGDVAVGAPFKAVSGRAQAGGVLVVLGSAEGLDTGSGVFISQAGDTAGRVRAGELMGWSLATGDFDDDGIDDLAVGSPGEAKNGMAQAGAVNVLYGSSEGLRTDNDRQFSQKGPLKGRPRAEDLFGFALAATDLDCDGVDDLAIGVPNENVDGVDPAGSVNLVFGSRESGLGLARNARLDQSQARVAGSLDFNQFGASLVSGDFNGDGCGDLVIGAHTTNIGGSTPRLCSTDPRCKREAGAVVAVYGARTWPRVPGSQLFSQAGAVAGRPAAFDFFGRTLAAVDANGDGRDDLVVGVPGKAVRRAADAGAVVVIDGSSRGLDAAESYVRSQRGRIKGRPERGDQFGAALFANGS